MLVAVVGRGNQSHSAPQKKAWRAAARIGGLVLAAGAPAMRSAIVRK